jgi:hypothetical protein
MGNFSRNTYDRTKLYTSVRLQQGVPLVDADWNEQADILRNQASDTLGYALGTGVVPGSSMTLSGAGLQNDFWLQQASPGQALINGRLVTFGPIQYSKQPWTDPAVAAAAGVPIIPALTTPSANRNDCVYLDVWEREVNSIEDPNLVNPVIGVETAVRSKWAVAVRVNENSLIAANPPAGHMHMRIAILERTTGTAQIGTFNPSDLTATVVDARQVLALGDSTGLITVPPVFVPAPPVASNWVFFADPAGPHKIRAYRNSTDMTVGFAMFQAPEGARLTALTVRGRTSHTTTFQLVRVNYNVTSVQFSSGEILSQSAIPPTDGVASSYFLTWAIDGTNPINRIDNRNYLYALFAVAPGAGVEEIHGIALNYLL